MFNSIRKAKDRDQWTLVMLNFQNKNRNIHIINHLLLVIHNNLLNHHIWIIERPT